MQKNKHIHFIGICGVAMSALAIAFHKKGYKVTGSDKGFYPPVSTHLKDAGIDFYPGWHVDKMTKDGDPDLVIVGNVAGSENPEWQYVQEHNIPYKSYPEAIAEFFVKENSIVCAGTYGKTTTTTLLSWILLQNNFDPSYMFGGLSVNNIPAASLGGNTPRKISSGSKSRGNYSVIEGDEYKSARWDNRPKFAHYSPTHLLLTAVEWDHADVYPTKKSYFDAFETLVKSIPKDGLIVANEQVLSIASLRSTQAESRSASGSDCPIVSYGSGEVNYQWSNETISNNGFEFSITHEDKTYRISSPMLGRFNIENITGAFAMAHKLGIEPENIITAIKSFKGIKRRLEKHFDGDITVIDDIAHSPAKATSTLKTLRSVYKSPLLTKEWPGEVNIIAIFEPNTGNRQQEAIPGYNNAFTDADEVIIPRLTRIKIDPDKPAPLVGKTLRDVIARTHDNVQFISDDEKLVEHIISSTKKGDVVVFLGSHGFRGMIEDLIQKISV